MTYVPLQISCRLTMCNIANSEKRTQMFKEYDIYKQYLPHFMKKNHFISSNKPF